MGSWTARTEETVTEDAAGDGKRGSTVLANPGEKIQFDFYRIDGGANNEPWLAAIDASVDENESGWTNPHLRTRRVTSTQTRVTITMSGHYSYSPWIENDDATPLDAVSCEVHVRKDGVSI